ncbi:MAG TPA: Rrf2 family transcriptional regulator [Lacipirellulaceae bacterium]|nr:Rrf2 family transcriptional regulator [Lacipirellulaceae bacterium]
MKLSRTVAYAVHAMLQLSDAPTGVAISRSQLAAVGRLPERFLLEVLHSLIARGLLRSTRGVDGGFALAMPIDEIKMRDIFEAFNFPSQPFVPDIDGQSSMVRDQLLAVLNRAYSAALRELEKLSLAELHRNCSTKAVARMVLDLNTIVRPSNDFAAS